MQNKLKDVFSNKKYDFGVSLFFKDSESKEKFMDALETMESEGRAVNVEGISKISTSIKDGDLSYPFLVQNDISSVTVSPSVKFIPIKVDTEYGEKVVDMERYPTHSGCVLKTGDEEVVFIKLDYNIHNGTINFVYRMQPEFAEHLKEIIEKLTVTLVLINSMFKSDDKKIMKMEVTLLLK